VLGDLRQHWEAFDSFTDVVEDRAAAARWDRMSRDTMAERARWAALRALASAPSATRRAESEQLLELAREISDEEPSFVERWNWRVMALLGHGAAKFWPPFSARFAARGLRRQYTNWRKERTGV
jgi:hypothetical protein